MKNNEYKFLDSFLRDNCLDMNLVKAHGFITAIVSFPDLFLPRQWLPIISGNLKDHNPGTAKTVMDTLIKMYQQVTISLHSDRQFKFLLDIDNQDIPINEAPYECVQEWCKGYCLALVWNDKQWLNHDEDYITKACATFFLVAELLTSDSTQSQGILVDSLSEIVKSLYVYWLGSNNELVFRELRDLQASMTHSLLH